MCRWRTVHGFLMDKRHLKANKSSKKKVALKYCGGCDPAFDRVGYFRQIKLLAGDCIEWGTLEDQGYESVLLIQGCDAACTEKNIGSLPHNRIISVRSNDCDPGEIVNKLLSTEVSNED